MIERGGVWKETTRRKYLVRILASHRGSHDSKKQYFHNPYQNTTSKPTSLMHISQPNTNPLSCPLKPPTQPYPVSARTYAFYNPVPNSAQGGAHLVPATCFPPHHLFLSSVMPPSLFLFTIPSIYSSRSISQIVNESKHQKGATTPSATPFQYSQAAAPLAVQFAWRFSVFSCCVGKFEDLCMPEHLLCALDG